MSSSDALRDYLRSGRYKVVRPEPAPRPVSREPKRHILVLQRGGRKPSNQSFAFDPGAFDVTLVPWKAGDTFAMPVAAVSLVLVDFAEGVCADTAVYPLLARLLPDVPVMIVADCDGPIDRIVALELGVDDFVAKPAHPRELQARARAILRDRPDRGAPAAPGMLCHGGIRLDLVNRTAVTERGPVKLRNAEFWLLHGLVEGRGQLLTRDTLVAYLETHARESDRDPRAVDVLISRLRGKLDLPGRDSVIRTVRGQGYRL